MVITGLPPDTVNTIVLKDAKDNTPSDIDSLQKKNYELRNEVGYWKKQHQRAVLRETELQEETIQLKARIRYLEQQLYGRKTETTSAPSEKESATDKPKKNRGQQPGNPGHGRRNNEKLPEEEQIYDLDDNEIRCPICGKPAKEFEETEDSEIYETEVRAHKRKIRKKKYGFGCNCKGRPGIITAPGPSKLIQKSRIGISIWVMVILDKYQFGHPLERILKRLSVYNLNIALGTVVGGLKKIAPLFKPIYQAIEAQSLRAEWWQADETRWSVFEKPEGKLTFRWYLWVFISRVCVVYIMDPSRATSVIENHLGTIICGILLVDRYSAYKSFAKKVAGIVLAFCWAHVRRDFLNAGKKYPELEEWAFEWKARIGAIYHLNNQRLEHTEGTTEYIQADKKLRGALKELEEERNNELAQPKLHHERKHVLNSMSNHWDGLTVFVDHPYIPMDNNNSERKMRNPAVGRKNYYGNHAIWSAHFSATMFSILETLKLWHVNPHEWLLNYLTACADNGGTPPEDIAPFLPWEQLIEEKEECDIADANSRKMILKKSGQS